MSRQSELLEQIPTLATQIATVDTKVDGIGKNVDLILDHLLPTRGVRAPDDAYPSTPRQTESL
jgi:hypothetical protein